MYHESSSELDDFALYRCPKCTRSFSSLRNLRDHIDIVHLYRPTRDTDEENLFATDSVLDGFPRTDAKRPTTTTRRTDPDVQSTLDLEYQLRLAKELELRQKILHRHSKSEDELRALNEEIMRAKQRQFEMCNIIHNAKKEIDQLRQSAEKIAAEQQLVIDRLRAELKEKDKQLEKSTSELEGLIQLRRRLQEDFQLLTEERERHRRRLEEICTQLQHKEQLITDKQKEVESLQTFIKEASKKEIAARKKLEDFINGLLDRAESAEEQVRRLTKQLSVQGINPGAIYKSVSDNQLHQRPDLMSSGGRNFRSQSADPLMSEPIRRVSSSILSTSTPPSYVPRPTSQPQYMYASIPETESEASSRHTSRKLPSGPFSRDYEYCAYPVQPSNYEKVPKPKWTNPDGSRKTGSRCDNDRPESGYGSIHHGNSCPQSRLSSVSEHSIVSTDTVVPASEFQGECSRSRRSPTNSCASVLDIDDEVFELNLDRKLPVDDNGILWNDDDHDPGSSKANGVRRSRPKQSGRLSSSDFRQSKNGWQPDRIPDPVPLSRMSSVTSVEKDILSDINQETKFEMQRYKFLLRDRLRLLKEQEKIMDSRDEETGNDDAPDRGALSDSDLTSVTSDDSLTSMTFTSFSEISDEDGSRKKWKKSNVKSPLIRKGNIKRLVAEKPKPISIVPQTSAKPMTITPPSGARANRLSVSGPSAFHSPVVAMSTNMQRPPSQQQQQQQQRRQQGQPEVDPATLQRHSLLFLIFNHLDTRTLSQISIVCREWRDISRHPALWRKVFLSNSKISPKFLFTISRWCTAMQMLTLEGLRARSKKSYETVDEYKQKTRGILEGGFDALLKASQKTLISLRIVDCGNILTDRCLWLASCHCHHLQRVTYVSNTDPTGSEVIWSLGAGCREISKLVVPPLYPNERGDRFTNRCLQMISWCWPDLKILAVGGRYIGKKGLFEIARNCSTLRVLELHQMKTLTDEIALGMCGAGLRHLETLSIVFTKVAPSVIKIFVDSCPRLKSLKVHLGISDYYNDTENVDNRKAFAATVKEIELLKKTAAIAKVLTVEVD